MMRWFQSESSNRDMEESPRKIRRNLTIRPQRYGSHSLKSEKTPKRVYGGIVSSRMTNRLDFIVEVSLRG